MQIHLLGQSPLVVAQSFLIPGLPLLSLERGLAMPLTHLGVSQLNFLVLFSDRTYKWL